ncbi:uncharacterized protein LOC120341967 [Styela clava]
MNAVQKRGMHEMRKSEAVHQHHHRHVDGKKEMFGMHKFNDKSSSGDIGSSSSVKSNRDHRSTKSVTSQIPGAIRICGDWSEHLSSNGKVYFFNNKTKSSQWERPKEWSSSRAIEVKKDKSKSSGLHNKVSNKHSTDGSGSSSCGNAHHAALKQHKSYSDAKKLQMQQRSRTNHESEGSKDRDYRTTNSSTAKDRDYRDIDYRDTRLSNNIESRSQDRDYRSSVHHNSKPNLQRQSSSQNMRSSSQSIKEYNGKNISMPNDVHLSRSESRTDHKDSYNIDGRDDRPRSSNSTPRSATDIARRDTLDNKIQALMETSETEAPTANGSNDATAPSSLVKTLSTVLNQAGTSASEENKETSIEGHLKNALQMLLSVAAQNQQISGTTTEEVQPVETEVTKEEEPPPKRVRPSNPIDDHISNSTLVSQSTEKVLNDLGGLLDERHVLHVQGWPADQLERQSTRLCDENHQFVVSHTSQLSASMKMARSQVRSAEIHSTLHEQRVLYIRQQIKDLEKSTTVAPFT